MLRADAVLASVVEGEEGVDEMNQHWNVVWI